jgi:1-acyl-sn-glycerol-3-phosphate acyltransferase
MMGSQTFMRLAHEAPFHDAGHGYDVFGLHPPTLAIAVSAGAALYEWYFRVDSQGIEHVPATGAAILVANHGGVLPIDAAMMCLDVLRRTEPPRIPRAVADHFVPRLPFVSTLFARLGVVSGTRANVRALIEQGELIAIWPEGVAGPAKPFRDRYQIKHWRVGFAELAIRYHVPVVPVAIVGAEESWPLAMKLRGLHPFGSPYLPVAATPVPLPTHYRIRYGEPLHLDHGHHTNADDPDMVANAATRVQVALERLLEDALRARRGVFR